MSGGLTGFPCETGRGRCGQREAGQLGPPLPAPGRASFPLMLSTRVCVTSLPGNTSLCVCENSGPWVPVLVSWLPGVLGQVPALLW